MKKVINIILATVVGMFPLLGVLLIGILIYNEHDNFIGGVMVGILTILAIQIGVSIFKSIRKIGFVKFITAVSASPDLDNSEKP